MTRTIGHPEQYCIPVYELIEGAIYATHDNQFYKLVRRKEASVYLQKVFKGGRVSETTSRWHYGQRCFFFRLAQEPEPTPPPEPVKVEYEGPWTNEGRTLFKNNLPMFTLDKRSHMSPTELDALSHKLRKFLNLMEPD